MRLAMLASAACIHSIRWANALAEKGVTVDLITLHPPSPQLSTRVHCHRLPFNPPHGYFLAALPLRRLLRRLRSDLLHAHYASGYGTLGRLTRFHPQILSVWGSDVFDFPSISPVHRHLIRRNLSYADCVCSTSHVMARQVGKLVCTPVEPVVIPFGIDTNRFAPTALNTSSKIVVGTVKTLSPTYGIDTLISGFAECRARLRSQRHPAWEHLRLRIVGGGPQREQLERLAMRLQVAEITTFVGPVEHDKVSEELNHLDIYVAVSRSESFGVAVIEASACERPVIVSDVGGLPEIVQDGRTGLVVPRESPSHLADALAKLVLQPELREELGRNGREMVQEQYEWGQCVTQMVDLYEQFTRGNVGSCAA